MSTIPTLPGINARAINSERLTTRVLYRRRQKRNARHLHSRQLDLRDILGRDDVSDARPLCTASPSISAASANQILTRR